MPTASEAEMIRNSKASRALAMNGHEKLPPHNIELEQALLGAILVNNDAFCRVSDFLEPWHFCEPIHQKLYEIAGSLVRVGKSATPITLKTFLPSDLDVAGLTASQYLARLAAEATTVINAPDYGRNIVALHHRRCAIVIGEELISAAFGHGDLQPIMTAATSALGEISIASSPAALQVSDAGDDMELPPPRGWLLSNQFCRRFLSSVVAPGSTGKSALRYAQIIALITGRPITGQHIFRRCRALLLSLEDDLDEMRRRIAAVRIHHMIDRSDLKGWLFYAAPKGLKLAEMQGGSRQLGQLERLLRQEIERLKPDLVVLDPFVKLHALEENDNGAMDFVCDLLAKLAIEYDIAVDAPHHAKKGNLAPGDADTGRGGSSIRDAGRLVYTLATMSDDEAKTFGLTPADRRAYIRLDSAKVNLVPGTAPAAWFKLVGVRLENGNNLYPNGDEIQTVAPWDPPDTWANLPTAALNAALTEIDAGLPNGQRYSDVPAARDRAAWPVVHRHCPDRTETQAREIIRTWVRNGVLYREDYDDPIDRKERKGLRLDANKRPSSQQEC